VIKDGFSWEFYRRCWPVIKDDVVAAMQAVWLGRDQGFGNLNEALITLLPKKDRAIDLTDFRPISHRSSADQGASAQACSEDARASG
jgi:hypothetical protein